MSFVARQPIFDVNMQVFGYELLFRSGMHEVACFADPQTASCSTLDTSAVLGVDVLCDGRRAFINCTRERLVKRLVELFPPESIVVEILEDVRGDAEVLAACRDLKRSGYLIALDDVVSLRDIEPFLPFADIVKADFRLSDIGAWRELAKGCAGTSIQLLAEKVENQQEHQQALDLGFRYFQGFFFQKPAVMASQDIPALQVNYFRLLHALNRRPLDLRQLEQIIESEPSLCYRMLRYLNSPLFAFGTRIHSVFHALTLIGEHEIRRWLSVAATVTLAAGKPDELVTWALIRAKLCELLAERSMGPNSGAFLPGLVSALPPLLDLPLENILKRVPLALPLQNALRGENNPHGQVYRAVLAYEAGNWVSCANFAAALGLRESLVSQSYFEAVHWAGEVSRLGRLSPVMDDRVRKV